MLTKFLWKFKESHKVYFDKNSIHKVLKKKLLIKNNEPATVRQVIWSSLVILRKKIALGATNRYCHQLPGQANC